MHNMSTYASYCFYFLFTPSASHLMDHMGIKEGDNLFKQLMSFIFLFLNRLKIKRWILKSPPNESFLFHLLGLFFYFSSSRVLSLGISLGGSFVRSCLAFGTVCSLQTHYTFTSFDCFNTVLCSYHLLIYTQHFVTFMSVNSAIWINFTYLCFTVSLLPKVFEF